VGKKRGPWPKKKKKTMWKGSHRLEKKRISEDNCRKRRSIRNQGKGGTSRPSREEAVEKKKLGGIWITAEGKSFREATDTKQIAENVCKLEKGEKVSSDKEPGEGDCPYFRKGGGKNNQHGKRRRQKGISR